MNFPISPAALRTKSIFKRCITCPSTAGTCTSACPNGQICVVTNGQLTCNACPSAECQDKSTSGQVSAAPPTPTNPAGPIAGGVVGGVIIISLLGFCVWWFFIRHKQREQSQLYEAIDLPLEKSGSNASSFRDARSRASTHTVASVASTVLTRASNVIQIAYIPGVTNRTEGGQDQPPVPPIPIPLQQQQQQQQQQQRDDSSERHETLMFHPTDLRNSAWSELSARKSMAKSIAPSLQRASMASFAVPNNAVTVLKAKPALINVNAPSPLSLEHDRSSLPKSSSSQPLIAQLSRSVDGATAGPITATAYKPKALTITKGRISPTFKSPIPYIEPPKRLSTIQSEPSTTATHTPTTEADEFSKGLRISHHQSPFTDLAELPGSPTSPKSLKFSKPSESPEALESPGSTDSVEGPFSDKNAVKE